jgi:hypothetical protein
VCDTLLGAVTDEEPFVQEEKEEEKEEEREREREREREGSRERAKNLRWIESVILGPPLAIQFSSQSTTTRKPRQ